MLPSSAACLSLRMAGCQQGDFLRLTQRNQHFLQALAGVDGKLVIRSQDVLTDRQRALVQASCFWGLALHLLQACEIIQRLSRLNMLRSVLLLADVQRPHVEWLGLCILSFFSIEVRQSKQRIRYPSILPPPP